MNSSGKILYSRKEAAAALSVSLATVQMLYETGQIKIRRLGQRVLIHHSELERFASRDHAVLWPPKIDGKTVRRLSSSSPSLP